MANVRKLAVIGQSRTYYLTLPKEIVDELKWRKGQKLEIQRRGKTVIIKNLHPLKKKVSQRRESK